jgi:hypothetical protein
MYVQVNLRALAYIPLKFDDKLCVSDKSKAGALNSQFHSVFTRENAPIPNQSPYTSISDLNINSQGVAKQLSEPNSPPPPPIFSKDQKCPFCDE